MLKIQLQGFDAAAAAIRELGTVDKRDILTQVAKTVEAQTQQRIAVEKTSPTGQKWKRWAPAYAKTRQPGQSLLEVSGKLRESITSFVFGTEATIGTPYGYGRRLQRGDSKLPARPFLGLSPANEDEVLEVVEDALVEQIRKAGF